MHSGLKKRSKTVQQRQLKRLTPRHCEILLRYAQGQRQKQIAKEMNLSAPWISVVINSPLFQQELQQRWRVEESALMKRIGEREAKRLNAIVDCMHDGVKIPPALQQPSIFDRVAKMQQGSDDTGDGIGETIILALSRIDAAAGERPASPVRPTSTPADARPTNTVEPVTQPIAEPPEHNSMAYAEVQHAAIGSDLVQAARFYSRVFGEWVWIALDYPGERDSYSQLSQALGLTNASQWRVYPHSGPPADGYVRYSRAELGQLRGKTVEALRAFHIAKKAKIGEGIAPGMAR